MNPITLEESIASVPEKQWEILAGDNIFASYGWLLTVEKTLPKQVTPLYFLLRESKNLSGAAVCYLFPRHRSMVSPDNLLMGRLRKFLNPLRISFQPILVCAPFKAYGSHLFIDQHLDPVKQEVIAETILNGIENEACKKNLSLCFPRILTQEQLLIKLLSRRQYLQTIDLPQSYLDISWDSFEDYKKFIRSRSLNMKKGIKREINKNRKSGVNIDQADNLNTQAKRLYSLLNGNCLKHNQIPLLFQADFLSRLKKNIGSNLIIFQSVKKGQISGLSVMMRKGHKAHLAFIGVDRQLSKNDATYFNLAFYTPIKEAIDKQIKRLYCGNAMYDMKIRRGCEIQNAYFFHKPRHRGSGAAIRIWFSLHRFWYRKKFSGLNSSD